MSEKTNPGIALPPERGDEPTGPIEGASAGAKHFRNAAAIASQQTRDEVGTAMGTIGIETVVGEQTPPDGTRAPRKRPSTTFPAVKPTTTTEEPATGTRSIPKEVTPADGNNISDSAKAAKGHAIEAQEILERGVRRARGEQVEATQQIKVVKPEAAEETLAAAEKPAFHAPRRISSSFTSVPKPAEQSAAPTAKSLFQKAVDMLTNKDKTDGTKDGSKK